MKVLCYEKFSDEAIFLKFKRNSIFARVKLSNHLTLTKLL